MWTIFVFCMALACTQCAVISESNGTAEGDVDALTLVKLGRETHKPMLTLLGIAIRNLHPCGEWTSWSKCEASLRGNFGTKARTRKCIGGETSTDVDKTHEESDVSLCEGRCPIGANLTSHGFCLKLHLTELIHDDAEKYCENEGGYLINIDSEEKYQDVKVMLTGLSTNLCIGGRRKTASSPWVYKYGSQVPFIKWGSGDPDNGTNDLCLIYYPKDHLWYDNTCSTKRPFVCEFP